MSLFGLRSPVLNPSDYPGPAVIQSLLCHHEISFFVFKSQDFKLSPEPIMLRFNNINSKVL